MDGLGERWYTSVKALVAVNGMVAEKVCSDISTREVSDVRSQFGKSGYLNLSRKFAVKLRVKILYKFASLCYY